MSRLTFLLRFSAPLAWLALAAAVAAPTAGAAAAWGIGHTAKAHPACGGPENPIEVILLPDWQDTLFRSLPIAGLLVSPDDVVERAFMNPRVRATTSCPLSGMGTASPMNESVAVVTPADPPDG